MKKKAICPVCLEKITTDLYFTSDDYLYHGNCFNKIDFEIQYLDKIFHIIFQ